MEFCFRRQLLRCFELFWTLSKLGETKPYKVGFVSNFSKPFSPPLIQTLAKSSDEVSLLTKHSELKFDHRFGWPFDIKKCMPTFAIVRAIWTPSSPTLAKMNDRVWLLTNLSYLNLIIDLDARLIDNHTLQLSRRFELFSPLVTPFLSKPHDEVSLLTNFLKLKFDHIFRCTFGR